MSDPERDGAAPASDAAVAESATSEEPRELELAVETEEADESAPPAPVARDQHDAVVKERDELRDLLLRKRADFDNFRRRMERERQSTFADATADLLKALLPTLDNLERALAAAGDEGTPLREGILLVQRDLWAALEARGLVAEDPSGAAFDPARQEALSHEHVPGVEPGRVVEVFRKAYLFRDKLLRPALVKVSKEPPEAPSTPERMN